MRRLAPALLAAARRLAGRLTATQLTVGMGVAAALALSASVIVTGAAVRADQREKAALGALQDYAAMVAKLGAEETFSPQSLAQADLEWLGAWMAAFQDGPGQADALQGACDTGRGGAGVRLIEAPGLRPAGASVLARTPAERLPGLGEGVHLLALDRGALCADRAVEVVAVRQSYGGLTITAGRLVERSGAAWGWAALAVGGMGAVILMSALGAAALARRRMAAGIDALSLALDRAAGGDFGQRAPEADAAPELESLTRRVNLTLDRLEEILTWLRDASDQLAHDFRTPLARVSARLDQLAQATDPAQRESLMALTRRDLVQISRSMNEALALRDGEAWTFETLRLDDLAEATAELYGPLAAQRGVTIRTDLSPVSVLGVRSLLQRAAANLVDNAVKFSPDGGVVTLSVRHDEGRAVFIVADQGPGMDRGALNDFALRGEGRESHGMGLPFVRAVLGRHGARLIIDDGAPGAVVTLRF